MARAFDPAKRPVVELRGIAIGGIESLSRREGEVLSLAAAGYLDKEICRELGVSPNTLRTYWSRIRTKVGEVPRSALAVAYVRDSAPQSELDASDADWEINLERWTYRSLRPGSPVPHVSVDVETPYEDVLSQIHPEDAANIRRFFDELRFSDLDSYSHSVRMITPIGVETTSSFVRVLRDESGKAVTLRGTRAPSLDFATTPTARVELGYWERDVRSGEFTADEGFCAIFHIDPADPNLREAALAQFHPDEESLTRNFVDNALKAGKTRERATHRLRNLDGSYRWITTELRIKYDGDGPVIALGTVMAYDPD